MSSDKDGVYRQSQAFDFEYSSDGELEAARERSAEKFSDLDISEGSDCFQILRDVSSWSGGAGCDKIGFSSVSCAVLRDVIKENEEDGSSSDTDYAKSNSINIATNMSATPVEQVVLFGHLIFSLYGGHGSRVSHFKLHGRTVDIVRFLSDFSIWSDLDAEMVKKRLAAMLHPAGGELMRILAKFSRQYNNAMEVLNRAPLDDSVTNAEIRLALCMRQLSFLGFEADVLGYDIIFKTRGGIYDALSSLASEDGADVDAILESFDGSEAPTLDGLLNRLRPKRDKVLAEAKRLDKIVNAEKKASKNHAPDGEKAHQTMH